LAEQAHISRQTLHKVERGDPGVSLGVYGAVMHALGLDARLAELVTAKHDPAGVRSSDDRLPQRIHEPKPRRVGMTMEFVPLSAASTSNLDRTTTAEQRLALVDTLTREGWALAGRPLPTYRRAETPIRVVPLEGRPERTPNAYVNASSRQ